MTFQTKAIYEGGVLRPLMPLALKEHEVVSLSIATNRQEAADNNGDRQRQALLAYIAKMEALPDDAPRDGRSNRDHDLLIYGREK